MHTIQIEFKIDRKTWLTLDAEHERSQLSQGINNALKEAKVGWWSGKHK